MKPDWLEPLGNLGNLLTVYSSLPLQGPSGAISTQIVNGTLNVNETVQLAERALAHVPGQAVAE